MTTQLIKSKQFCDNVLMGLGSHQLMCTTDILESAEHILWTSFCQSDWEHVEIDKHRQLIYLALPIVLRGIPREYYSEHLDNFIVDVEAYVEELRNPFIWDPETVSDTSVILIMCWLISALENSQVSIDQQTVEAFKALYAVLDKCCPETIECEELLDEIEERLNEAYLANATKED